ncbi:hypothetical protein MNBD_GAMMA08-1529, partial [hydrothermal vent metagenome]
CDSIHILSTLEEMGLKPRKNFTKSSPSPQQVNQLRREREAREQQQIKDYENAAKIASTTWKNSIDIIHHPYLTEKNVSPLGVRQHNGYLIIPLYDVNGKIWTYQIINPDKNADKRKKFLFGGDTKGHFYQIGELTKTFFIAEGFSTAASVHLHYKRACFVAFSCHNLTPVAKNLKAKYPDHKIIIAADNDTKSPTNAGLTHGRQAAKAIKGELIYPVFEKEAKTGTDFNDYFNGENYEY